MGRPPNRALAVRALVAVALLPLLPLLLAACGLAPAATTSAGSGPAIAAGQHVTLPGSGSALTWGSGPYGLVLLHDVAHAPSDWAPQATAFGNDGMTVLAPEQTDPGTLAAAIAWLRSSRGTARVAVLAAGSTSGSVASLAASDAAAIDQALLISPSAGGTWPWAFPTLFAAGQDAPDAGIAQRMSSTATGQWNELLLVRSGRSGQSLFTEGGASATELMTEVQRRLDERR
jgi:hypothetical protein